MSETPAQQIWPRKTQGWGHRRGIALIAVTALACLMSIDSVIHSIAMPAVEEEFGLGPAVASIASGIGTLMLSACLLGAGVLGDLFGRRRVLLGGVAGMVVGGVITAWSPDAVVFVLGRMVTGVSTAAGLGTTLAMLPALVFPRELPHVFGLWFGAQALAVLAGAVVGGALITEISWGAGYLMIAVLAAALLVPGWLLVPDSRAAEPRPFDRAGVLLAAAALFALIGALGQAAVHGWGSPVVLVAVVLAAVALVAFVRCERRSSAPALPLRLFASAAFAGACLTGVMVGFAHAAYMLQTATLLEDHRGRSAMTVVVVSIPLYVGMVLGAVLSGQAQEAGRRARLLCASGLACCGVGALLLTTVDRGTDLWVYSVAGAVIGFGVMWAQNPQSVVIMTAAPPNRAGTVSAVKYAMAQLGFGLGLGILVPVVAAFPGAAAHGDAAFFHGFTVAMGCTAVALFAAAAIVVPLLWWYPPRTEGVAAKGDTSELGGEQTVAEVQGGAGE